MLSLHPKGWRSSAAKLRPPVGHEIAEDARGPRDVGLPVDRTDDVATAILGAVQLRHQDIIPPEAALPEVVRPGRPPIPIDEDAAVGIRQVQCLLRSDLHARLGRTGGHKTGELEGRTIFLNARRRDGAGSEYEGDGGDLTSHDRSIADSSPEHAVARKQHPAKFAASY